MAETDHEHSSPVAHQDKIDALARSVVKVFGEDACTVIERQIEASEGNEAIQATWIDLWQQVCGREGRRA